MDGHNDARKRLGQMPQKPSDVFDLIGGTSTGGFVCATSKSNPVTYRFRSYDTHKTYIKATISQAARATSAATTFFDPVSIDGMEFVDGALGANNLVDQLEEEAMEIWCPVTGNLKPLVKCFISIGTGSLSTYNIDDRVDKFVAVLAKMATDAEKIAESSLKRWRQHYDQNRYFRFNVDHGLQSVGMKEYKKKGEIQAATYRYLDSHMQSIMVRKCVENLTLKNSEIASSTWFASADYYHLERAGLDFERLIAASNATGLGLEDPAESYADQPPYDRPAETIRQPQRSFGVPSEPCPSFINQIDHFERLCALFSQKQHQRAVLVGLCGSGKTQIALDFAQWIRQTYPEYSVLWLSGEDLQKSYTQLSQELNLFKMYGSEYTKPLAKVLFQRYLKSETLEKWFLIIDNVDDDQTLFGAGGNPGSAFRRRFEDSIGTLCSFFLLVPRAGSSSYDMPTVVHLAARVWVKHSEASQKLTKQVTNRLDKLVPEVDWPKRFLWQRYKLHAFHVLFECEDSKVDLKERLHLTIKVGLWLLREREVKEAIPWLERALALIKRSHLKNSQNCIHIQSSLAGVYAETGRAPKAVQLAQKAVAMQEKHFPKNDSMLIEVSCALSRCHRHNNCPEKEIDRLEKLKKLKIKRSVEDKIYLLGELGRCYGRVGKPQDAIENLNLSITAAKGIIAPDDPGLLITKNHLAYAFSGQGQIKEVIAIYEETLPLHQKALSKSDPETLSVQLHLSRNYWKTGWNIKAISLLEELIRLQRETLGETHENTMWAESYLAEAYSANREIGKALELYKQMVRTRQEHLSENDEQRKWAEAAYNACIQNWRWTWTRR
ncbi:hypothetical protein IL306_013653 [Fusarium sp. DS 682]|nr:hypothetical protein IL306_013653 [Fusarium sp. DS 682]